MTHDHGAGEQLWLEAAARVQVDLDDDLRADARELFVAEAARTRMTDRTGRVRIALRSGAILEGRLLAPFGPDGSASLMQSDGRILHVRCDAVVVMTGARAGLRDEEASPSTSMAAYLRDAWSAGEVVRALLCDGRWICGRVAFVGADHVDLDVTGELLTIPFGALEAWQVAPGA